MTQPAAQTAVVTGRRSLTARIGTLVRYVIGFGLLIWVLVKTDWSQVTAHLNNAHWGYLFLFVAITPVNSAFSVLKWQVLLRARQLHVRFGRLFGIYVVSQFYNNVLPSSVGGDVVRTALLTRDIHNVKESLASVVVERFTGLTVMVLLGVAAMALSPEMRSQFLLLVIVLAVTAGYLLLLAAILSPQVIRMMRYAARRSSAVTKIVEKIERFQHALHAYLRQPAVLLNAIVLSAVFYLGAILSIYWVCAGVGQPISFAAACLITPVVMLVALLPLTINGIGLTEWAFVVGFTALGLPGPLGLSAGLLLRAKQILWSSGCYAWMLAVSGRPAVTAADLKAAGHTNAPERG